MRLPTLLAALFCLTTFAAPAGPLHDYVKRPDDSYGWTVRQTTRVAGCDVAELTLTSQTWRGEVWRHRLIVIAPPNLPAKCDAVLVIDGGRWSERDAKPGEARLPRRVQLLAAFARQLKAPVAVLMNVPRQPMFNGRVEDAIIALTFDEFLKTGEADWPLLLPMTKSATAAMTAIQEAAERDGRTTVEGFTVTGFSKRGWTSWLAAAVDDRVTAVAPMVIDLLDFERQFRQQEADYGEPSPRLRDYTERNLPQRLMTDEGKALRDIVDPIAYREKYTMPKLVVLGTNDAYWTVDALNLYWDQLPTPKAVVYVPNVDHDLSGDTRRILPALAALHQQRLPELRWTFHVNDEVQRLDVMPGQGEATLRLWTADAPTRDFRKARWRATPVPRSHPTLEPIELTTPGAGFRAHFVEVSYPPVGDARLPLRLSTTMRVIDAE